VVEDRKVDRFLMADYQFRSVGGALGRGLREALLQQQQHRRQEILDGIAVESRLREQARQDEAARRAEQLAKQQDADRLASLRGSSDLLAPGEADQLTAAGYRVNDVATLGSTRTNLSPDGQTVLGTTTAAPQVYGQRRAETPTEIITRRKREADAEQAAYERRLKEREKPPAKHLVTTVDANGRPVQRLVTEDELAAGIPVYEKPERNTTERAKRVWVERNGQPVFVTEDQITFGDKPYKGEGGSDKPTQSQSAADAFYARATDANRVLNQVEDSGTSIWNHFTPTWAQSSAGQAYDQARRQFTESYLRKDSGAAISDAEYANADRTYFPQPGDSAETVARKRQARQQILESLGQQGTGRSTGSNPNAPAVGTRGVVNGIPAVWDGRGWLPAGR
jgi:hypothetical protein